MRKLKGVLFRTLLLALVLSLGLAICADAVDEWITVFTQDFSSANEGSLGSESFPELKKGFSAGVAEGTLEIKSDNICAWEMRDTSSINASSNISDGIQLKGLAGALKAQDPLFETDHGLFEYTGDSTTCYTIERIGNQNAIRMLTFPQKNKENNAWKYKTNEYRFAIDEGIFSKDTKSYNIEVDLYFPDGKVPNFLSFKYWNGAKAIEKKLLKTTITDTNDYGTDGWFAWKFTVTDADFSAPGRMYGSYDPGTYSIIISQAAHTEAGNGYTKTAYIKRVSVTPVKDGDYVYSAMEKTVKLPLEIDDAYGNTRVSLDMMLPMNEKYNNNLMYNSGENSARVALSNEANKEVAVIQLDSTEEGQSLSIISDDNGEERKILIYGGEIVGETLNYQFNINWKEKTYTVAIKNNGEPIDPNKESYGPYTITNVASVNENVLVRNLHIKHNSLSRAMMTTIDNIKVEYTEDPDYKNCKADAEALTLDIPENNLVTDGFSLPTEGITSGATITWDCTWEGSAPDVLVINGSGDACTINRGAEQVKVTLIATFEIHGVTVIRKFEFDVEKHDDQLKAEADAEALALDIPENGIVTEGFSLPVSGALNSSEITWNSSNPAVLTISGNGDACTINRGTEQEMVTITATVNLNGFTSTAEFEVTVEEHADRLKAKEDAAAIELTISDSGRVKEDFNLPTTGTVNGSSIVWTSTNPEVLEIVENTVARVTRSENDTYSMLTATVSLNGYTAVREYTITAASLMGVYAEVYEIQETVSGGYLSASVDVQYPGKSGVLNFLAVVTNPETGEILARDIFTKTLTNADRYATVSCSVSGLRFEEGNEAKYYIWNGKRESFVNNAPSSVTELTAVGKGKGVRLNWTESEDDNNAIEYYSVYRDGEYVGSSVEGTFLDETAAVGMVYNYEVIPTDTNSLIGGSDTEECTPALGMYYYSFDKQGKGETVYSNGIGYVQTDGDGNSWIEEVTDSNGEKCYAATSLNKWVIGKTDKSCISGAVTDMMFEVVYLDTTGNINMVYNQVIPQGQGESLNYARKAITPIKGMGGTRLWKTAVFPIDNANFRESGMWSMADFGFSASSSGQMYIKEIRIIQAEDYN